MKKILSILILLALLCSLYGCAADTLSYGTYINEENNQKAIVVTSESITFKNINFDGLNADLQQDFGIDFKLTEKLSKENSYFIEDGQIHIEVTMGIAVSFPFENEIITVNQEKYIFKRKQ